MIKKTKVHLTIEPPIYYTSCYVLGGLSALNLIKNEMTPKEKAKELLEKYSKVEIQIGGQYDGYLSMQIHDAKECSLIVVDEILNAEFYKGVPNPHYLLPREFWEEVKLELER